MKNLNKSLSTALEAAGLIAVLVFAFLFVRANFAPFNGAQGTSPAAQAVKAATQAPAPTRAAALESGWLVYTDPDLEFSFAYPPTAHLQAGKNPVDQSKNISIQFEAPDQPYQGMSIRVEPNPQHLQGSQIAARLFESSTQKAAPAEFSGSLKPFAVGNLQAVQAAIPATNTEVTVIVPNGEQVLILSPVHDAAATQVEKDALDLFYQVLGTFKFNLSR